jgi:hypothetical protein
MYRESHELYDLKCAAVIFENLNLRRGMQTRIIATRNI